MGRDEDEGTLQMDFPFISLCSIPMYIHIPNLFIKEIRESVVYPFET